MPNAHLFIVTARYNPVQTGMYSTAILFFTSDFRAALTKVREAFSDKHAHLLYEAVIVGIDPQGFKPEDYILSGGTCKPLVYRAQRDCLSVSLAFSEEFFHGFTEPLPLTRLEDKESLSEQFKVFKASPGKFRVVTEIDGSFYRVGDETASLMEAALVRDEEPGEHPVMIVDSEGNARFPAGQRKESARFSFM
jgi:hypothetical protein